MAKDINIHIKTRGAQETKQQLDDIGRSAEKVGQTTEQMGTKGSRATEWLKKGFAAIAGPLAIGAIVTALARTSLKVAQFFDNLKARCDEAVRNVQELRGAYTDLFEALDAYDEKSRQRITEETNLLLQQARVSKQIGLPVINAYTRQFRGLIATGQLTEEQYTQGLRGMLGYAERHGGAATPDLIAMMAGWGMITPEQQGAFRRQIAAGAAASGLTDAELIAALGRGMPTIKAMGWTPEQAVETIATLAAGETGRKKLGLPATTMQALMAPQLTNVEKYGISEEVGKDPRQLLIQLQMIRGAMDEKAFSRMLVDIYGTEAAAGVFKLISAPRGDIRGVIARTAGPAGAAAELAEERARMQTLEARDAAAKARARQLQLEVKTEEQYMEDVREVGEEQRKLLRRKEPVRQWLREAFTIGEEKEKEEAAYWAWLESLTPEERRRMAKRGELPWYIWQRMTPQQKYEGLVGQGWVPEGESAGFIGAGQTIFNIHNSQDQHFYPRVGSDERGPIFTQD